ncbi:MAG: substrate-binding domain-containing protein [Verrucomicrobiota bacterium]
MKINHYLTIVAIAFGLSLGACNKEEKAPAPAEPQTSTEKAVEETKEAASAIAEATKDVAAEAAEKTKEMAASAAETTKEVAKDAAAATKEMAAKAAKATEEVAGKAADKLATPPAAPKKSQTIVIKGSDTLGAKMVPQLAEAFKAAGNKANFEIAAEGSSTAFTSLKSGTAQIGMSSRDVKDTEKAELPGLVEHVAGVDMIGVIVNSANGIGELTLEQVEAIFTGDIQNWSEVGGPDAEISVYTRNTSSGTYKTFQKLGMSGRDYGSETQKMAGNEQIAQEVGKNPNGIGYVGLAYTGANGVKAATVDGVAAAPANATTYPLARNLYYYTVGEPKGAAGKFLKWAKTSPEAAKIVEAVGFIAFKG